MKFAKFVACRLLLFAFLFAFHFVSPAAAQNDAKFKLSTACGYPLDWITGSWNLNCQVGLS